jgi:hypothetical protein
MLGILIFKGLTARHLYKSFSIKGLQSHHSTTAIAMFSYNFHYGTWCSLTDKKNVHLMGHCNAVRPLTL